MSPRKLANDCFALPPGVNWTPVDEALARLKDAMRCVVGVEKIATNDSLGRILAAAPIAQRSNPPYANSAVDGYGFAAASLPKAGDVQLPLIQGRAAAGVPFDQAVPAGFAIRILTGAMLPMGVDTVLLQEDATITDEVLQFAPGLKPFANARPAGEDMKTGDPALPAGHILRAPDIALLIALGCDQISVYQPLRVGVLSTGDEIVPAGTLPQEHQIYDANRPMLISLIRQWGMVPVDLGHAGDSADAVKKCLNDGAARADAIVTTGGASAGDEDHMSAVLRAAHALKTWRIAVKPGRPLALANWSGVPVFGLPGNPVAAFVCALIFMRPALCEMSGNGWQVPRRYLLPAAFSKNKKPGRREFLRARLSDNGVEVFASEGSGRISGISWADGLVELPDEAMQVSPGTPVTYMPYASFGL